MAPGGSWMLRGFMQESFGTAMEQERAEIAREAAAAESLRGEVQPAEDPSRLQEHPTPHVLPRFVQDRQQAEQADGEQPLEEKPTLRAMPTLDQEEPADPDTGLPLGERPTRREMPAVGGEPDPERENS